MQKALSPQRLGLFCSDGSRIAGIGIKLATPSKRTVSILCVSSWTPKPHHFYHKTNGNCAVKALMDTYTKNLDPEMHSVAATVMPSYGAGREYTAYFLWWRIVRSYVRCGLTVLRDKLLALLAITKRMMPVVHDDYVAGIWSRYLEAELLWKRPTPLKEKKRDMSRPHTYRAPSWCWASLDGAIEPGVPCRTTVFYKVEDVQLDHATTDTTGAIRGGRLWLRGLVHRLAVTRDPKDIDRL